MSRPAHPSSYVIDLAHARLARVAMFLCCALLSYAFVHRVPEFKPVQALQFLTRYFKGEPF